MQAGHWLHPKKLPRLERRATSSPLQFGSGHLTPVVIVFANLHSGNPEQLRNLPNRPHLITIGFRHVGQTSSV
ncbi:MAG: hypothetical protein A3C53_03455 [Omnitrophica WOR_2 bacterium RIFCSPHIGHO2_02_FULL_68_15]|nr:MAG: hypothetical protein A3C53_03455 [Omnitrophica WOR_2 bacterium RIFCSPHIGHO2_02_FULL_68_15]